MSSGRRYSSYYWVLVVVIWGYPLSLIFAMSFWWFLYCDVLKLPLYTVRNIFGVGFIAIAVASGLAFLLHVAVWIVPRIRRRLRPHWTTHIAAFAAFWLSYGTMITLRSRPFPFLPPLHERALGPTRFA
jgi:hypothetical protein